MKGDTGYVREAWEKVIGGERILKLQDPKAVVDVMLGAIAIVSGSRSMQAYMDDLEDRGQSHSRKAEVNMILLVVPDVQILCLKVIGALTDLSISIKYQEAIAKNDLEGAPPEASDMEKALHNDLVRLYRTVCSMTKSGG